MKSTENNRLTDEQMKLLASIFRIITKEITCDDDKELLAPGELGISYQEGTFYIRNPHTGELFCPNSIEHVRQILAKFNPNTGLLNADSVNGFRVYSSISQLTPLGITLSMDSIIRQMEYPSILISPVKYENPENFGFPGKDGIVTVIKIDQEFVVSTYYDTQTYLTYSGQYDSQRNYFLGWVLNGGVTTVPASTVGSGERIKMFLDADPVDLNMYMVRVTGDIDPDAVLIVNEHDPEPIYMLDGTPLATSVMANNIIMLIYDQPEAKWILLATTESPTTAVVTILSNRINALQNKFVELNRDLSRKIVDLKRIIETRPGNIETISSTYMAPMSGIDTIPAIQDYVYDVDKLVVNYNQTILRPGIDYVIETSGGIRLTKFTLNKDDVLQFIVIKQAAAAQ